MTRTTTLLAAALMTTVTGCDLSGLPGTRDGVTTDDEVAGEVAAGLESALLDKLQCEELLRPSTLARIRDVLQDPTFEEVEALVTNPQDLATVVAMAGAEVEGAVVLARNLERLVSTGAAADLVANGWDGVQCGEPVTAACTAGEQTTTVTCADGAASDLALDFALCTLGGTVHDGAARFARVDGDDASARLAFEALAFDEIKVLDGAVAVAVGTDALHVALDEDDADGALAWREHGGVVPLAEGGLSCGAELALDTLALDVDDAEAVVSFAGARRTLDDTLAIETTAPLQFVREPQEEADAACGCPVAGGLQVEVPRPLGRVGESAAARVAFAPTSADGLCAEARVTLVGWPTTCPLGGDCSKGATEATLAKVMTALCAAP